MNTIAFPRIMRLLLNSAAAALALVVVWIHWASLGPKTLKHDTVWSPNGKPLVISRLVFVPSNVSLTISAGEEVYFRPRAGLVVAGRLIVEGTADRTVKLERHPTSARLWAGISFIDTTQENLISYANLDGGGSEGSFLRMQHSTVAIDHVRLSGARGSLIETADSSLLLSHSVLKSTGKKDTIYARRVPIGALFGR